MSFNPLSIDQLQNFKLVDNIYLALTRIVGLKFSVLVDCSWLSGAFRFLPPPMVLRVLPLLEVLSMRDKPQVSVEGRKCICA